MDAGGMLQGARAKKRFLTGEIRAVNQLNQRLSELHRLGFTRCLIPRSGTQSLHAPEGLELLRVRNIREAMAVAL